MTDTITPNPSPTPPDCAMGLDQTEPRGPESRDSHPNDGGYREYRACGDNKTALIVPPLSDAELLLKSNLSQHGPLAPSTSDAAADANFWDELRYHARTQLLADSRQYTAAYRDVPSLRLTSRGTSSDAGVDSDRASVPVVMAGHQPTLFHPGVWFKNFALDRVARDTGAHAINLVIDNDVAASRSIRIPVRDPAGRVRYETVSYDVGGAGIPFEQARIRDLRQFDQFDSAVRQAIAPLVPDPCITQLWPHARAAIRRCEIAGCALAQARHSLEGELGWQTLEIPLGVAVRGLPFARFVMEIIDDAARFHQVYNDAADHYRAWHGIRSTAHPVPNLGRDDEWLELPLWVYGNDRPVRRAVWVRKVGNQLELSDRQSTPDGSGSILLPADNRDSAASALIDAASPEFKLRPRALMTTMFARLLLSDLFLHGIGGGKYDQLADRIICQFFHLTPPAFEVVSATVRLPGQDRDPARAVKMESLHRQIRDTQFHGEKWLDGRDSQAQSLINRKRELLDDIPAKGNRGQWHRELERINDALAAELQTDRQRMQASLQRLRLQETEEQILASRELSFCLFPVDELTSAFEQMLR